MDDDDLMKQVDQHFLDYDTISKDILKLNYEAHVVPSQLQHLYNAPFLVFYEAPCAESLQNLTQQNFN